MEDDSRPSVFLVYAEDIQLSEGVPTDAMSSGNCVGKLAFGHYGSEVHQALAPELAPRLFGVSSKPEIGASLYIMEYLTPLTCDWEGWVTLSNLDPIFIGIEHKDICSALDVIVERLRSLKFVHGDLRPNNLMIKMTSFFQVAKPVVIKVIDFEWANVNNKGRYPLLRNSNINYPGTPGGLIEANHDADMVSKCKDDIDKIVKGYMKKGTVV